MSVGRFNPSFKITSVLFIVLMSFAISVPANAFPQVHTVTFVENTSASDQVTAFENGVSTQPLTLLQNLNPSFTDVGYTFTGWNTSIDGSGTEYVDGSMYSFGADIGLYAQWIANPVVHTVTFFENSSASDTVTAFETGISPQSLTSNQDLNPTFTDAGYLFDGWNTSADGSGTPYSDGSIFSFSSDIGLYAQWREITVVHTVTFFENATSADSVSTYLSSGVPTPLTAFGSLEPSFSNPSHSFTGWNTSPNGTGTAYGDGATYSFNADTGLYAQWVATIATHTVTFNENDGAADSVTTYLSASVPTQLTAFGSLEPSFSNPSHSFTGWNTSPNGTGESFEDGTMYSFASNLVVYAQWVADADIHTVTFEENDSAIDSVSTELSEVTAMPLTLFTNLQPTFVNGSHTFSGWNTSRDGSGVAYSDGVQYSFDNDIVLYAQWTLNALVVISFNANGGNGTIASISGSVGSTITMPSQTGLIRPGFQLTKWSTTPNGSGTDYLVGQMLSLTESLNLYAQWGGQSPAILFGAIGTFKIDSPLLSDNLKSQVNRMASTIRSRKYLKVELFGYTSPTGLSSLNVSLSRARAKNVATYLRSRLNFLKVRGVTILASGEGAITGQASNAYSRVEVFGI